MGSAVEGDRDGIRHAKSAASTEDPSPTADGCIDGAGPSPSAETSSGVLPPMASPTLLGMAASVTKSAVKFAASGFKTVDRETHRLRIDGCADCQYYNGSRCHVCGCFIDKNAWLPHEDCPIGKWSA